MDIEGTQIKAQKFFLKKCTKVIKIIIASQKKVDKEKMPKIIIKVNNLFSFI